MAKSKSIKLPKGVEIPIVYEDSRLLAVDKPAGWMLAPDSWTRTGRNLQLALVSSIHGGAFWARSRNLKFLKFIHRLDADTSGLLLFGKHPGVMSAYSELFQRRQIQKTYLAVVQGQAKEKEWSCRLPIGPVFKQRGVMRTDRKNGKDAKTFFRLLEKKDDRSLVSAHPVTGRTHQIRVHLDACGLPVLHDPLYPSGLESCNNERSAKNRLALRAVALRFKDPFSKKSITIRCPHQEFLADYSFEGRGIVSLDIPKIV
ncbi:MAG TPA: RluA family pseudouridine synthase [Verrucomicrobiales bacterium]|nr:RluA family pseudouridine synthase [Verrucomicrobiales bacterium]HIL70739.1 RluA family pseudouridine synthase [Verrucomicrobiota bacterium]